MAEQLSPTDKCDGRPTIWVMTDDAWAPVATRVQAALNNKSAASMVLTPQVCRDLVVEIDGTTISIWIDGMEVDLPSAVLYLRDPVPTPPTDAGLSADETRFVTQQWQTMIRGLLTALQVKAVPILNPVSCAFVEEKTAQLIKAAEVGFATPTTLHGACPAAAARFAYGHADRCATKPFAPFVQLSNCGDSMQRLLTNLTNADDLRRGLGQAAAASPTIVQPFVQAPYEHRVVVVGDQVFSARTAREGANAIDVRRLPAATANVTVGELPAQVATRCVDLVHKSGLSHAAIDLLETHEGEYVFLDLDPSGHFLWVEQITGAPICEALAAALCEAAGLSAPCESRVKRSTHRVLARI